jgi:hypothetical protein
MNVEIGIEAAQLISENIGLKFSVQCMQTPLCDAAVAKIHHYVATIYCDA